MFCVFTIKCRRQKNPLAPRRAARAHRRAIPLQNEKRKELKISSPCNSCRANCDSARFIIQSLATDKKSGEREICVAEMRKPLGWKNYSLHINCFSIRNGGMLRRYPSAPTPSKIKRKKYLFYYSNQLLQLARN